MSTIKPPKTSWRFTSSTWIKIGVAVAVLAALLVYRESKFKTYGTHHELVGQPAPDFSIPLFGSEDEQLNLLDYRGQVVLIDFWATWCMPCKRQMPRLRHVGGYFADEDFQIITVNVDDEARTRRREIHQYLHHNHIKFPVGLDDHKVQMTYDAARIPTMILVGRDGTIRRYFGGMTTATHIKKAVRAELKRELPLP